MAGNFGFSGGTSGGTRGSSGGQTVNPSTFLSQMLPAVNNAIKDQAQQEKYKDLFAQLMEQGANTEQYSPLQAQYKEVKNPFGGLGGKGTIKVKTGYGIDPRFQLKGPESYIEKALQQQKLEEAQGLDKAQLAGAQGLAQSRANMSMRGGLTPQQRLQLEKQGMRDLMSQRQGIAGQGAAERARIGLEGDKMGREINKYNIEQELGQLGKAQELELGKYQTKMAGLAGQKAAEATKAAAAGQSKK